MESLAHDDITAWLRRWQAGDVAARERLAERIYPELKKLAGRRLAAASHSVGVVQTTEIVHDAYLRLLGQNRVDWQNRAHFFAIAARLMRRVILDLARRRGSARRGGGREAIPLEQVTLQADGIDLNVLALDRALAKLQEVDREAARVVELLYFSGLSHDEVAEALGIGRATVARRWRYAKAWLHMHLEGATASAPRAAP